jgi:hypothetical protein
MRVHLWLVFVSMLVVAPAIQGAPPEPSVDESGIDIAANTRVAVHVYTQGTGLSAEDERLALNVAREVFATASVDVAWTLCEPGTCLRPSAEALKLRIVLSRDRNEVNSGVLGHALIDSQAHAGVLATIFLDRTQRLANDLGIDHRVLLGRAIAHELGHLLLGTSTHGVGLMREVWSHDELLGDRRGDWEFNALDVSAMRNQLARRSAKRDGGRGTS